MQQWLIRKLAILSTAPKHELKSRNAAFSSRCADVETVKERDSVLNLFYNDWRDLMVCVSLFTHLCYIEQMFAVISLKLKAAGMSNTIYGQYHTEIQDIIKHNSIIQRDCEIDFHDFS